MVDAKGAATTAAEIVDQIAKIEPWVATVLPIFVPAAAPAIAVAQTFEPMVMAFVSRALHDIAADNNGDIMGAMIELFQHLSKGQPNSPTLSAPTGAITAG